MKTWTTNLVLLGIIMAVAVFGRLGWLGDSAFRADTIELYKYGLICDGKLPGVQAVPHVEQAARLWKNPPWADQIPVSESIVLMFLKSTGLEANHFTVRLPFALMGCATVLVVYFLCARIFGSGTALLAAALCALNPFHLYISRESYHYVGVAFFSTFSMWAFWHVWTEMLSGKVPKLLRSGLWLVAALAACHCHMSAWPVFGAQWLLLIVAGVRMVKTAKSGIRGLVPDVILLGVFGIAVLVEIGFLVDAAKMAREPQTEATVAHLASLRTGGWTMQALCWLLVAGIVTRLVVVLRRTKEAVTPYPLLATVAVLAARVLLPWVVNVLASPSAAFKSAYRPGQWLMIVKVTAGLFPSYTFGASWWGVALLLLVVCVGGWYVARTGWERQPGNRLLLVLAVEFVLLFIVMAVVGRGRASSHYFAPVWPCVVVLFAFLLRVVARVAGKPLKLNETRASAALLLLVLMYWAVPAWATMRLEGKPKPYKKIVAAIDEHLPPGSLVLVDRFLEAQHEMRFYYPPAAAQMVHLYPNEPIEYYVQGRWRDRAREFFEKYPDAAYLEMLKSYELEPELGPWDWPQTFFDRHVAITNVPGLTLRKWKFAPRGGFYAANTNGLIVNLHYNSRESIVSRAQVQGRRSLVLYGQGWFFLWQMKEAPQLVNWRALAGDGALELYNLTSTPLRAVLRIEGTTFGKAKRMSIGGAGTRTFNSGADGWGRVEFGPFELAPGRTTVVLHDASWSRERAALFAAKVEIVEAGDATAE